MEKPATIKDIARKLNISISFQMRKERFPPISLGHGRSCSHETLNDDDIRHWIEDRRNRYPHVGPQPRVSLRSHNSLVLHITPYHHVEFNRIPLATHITIAVRTHHERKAFFRRKHSGDKSKHYLLK